MRRVKIHPKEKIKLIHLRIDEIDKELDIVLQTGIPQKYFKLTKEKKRRENDLSWLELWHGRYKK